MVLTTLLALLLPGVSTAEPPSSQAEYERALTAYKSKDYPEALRRLEAAFDLEPKALYVYNIGRVLETMGRLAESREAFLRCLVIGDVAPEMRALAEEKAASLKPFVSRSLLRLSGIPATSRIQVDDDLIADRADDLEVEAGLHLVCVIPEDERHVSCTRHKFVVGVRLTWPPTLGTEARATFTCLPEDGITGLRLGGVSVSANFDRLESFTINAGRFDIEITHKAGPPAIGKVKIVGGPPKAISSLLPRSPASAAPIVLDVIEPHTNAWPWVVVGTGGAALAAGIGLIVVADTMRGPKDGQTQAEASLAWEDSKTYDIAGWALLGTGVAALAGGLTWAFIEPESSTSVSVAADGRAALLVFSGSF